MFSFTVKLFIGLVKIRTILGKGDYHQPAKKNRLLKKTHPFKKMSLNFPFQIKGGGSALLPKPNLQVPLEASKSVVVNKQKYGTD